MLKEQGWVKNHVFDHETRKSGLFPCYRLKINDFLSGYNQNLKIDLFTPLQKIPCYCKRRLGTLRLVSWWRVTYIVCHDNKRGRKEARQLTVRTRSRMHSSWSLLAATCRGVFREWYHWLTRLLSRSRISSTALERIVLHFTFVYRLYHLGRRGKKVTFVCCTSECLSRRDGI